MIRLACFSMYGPYGLGVVEMTADDIARLLRRYETYLALRKTDDPPDEIVYQSPIRWFPDQSSLYYRTGWFVLNDTSRLPKEIITVSDRIHIGSSGGLPRIFHASPAMWSTDVLETEMMDLEQLASLAASEKLAPDGR